MKTWPLAWASAANVVVVIVVDPLVIGMAILTFMTRSKRGGRTRDNSGTQSSEVALLRLQIFIVKLLQ